MDIEFNIIRYVLSSHLSLLYRYYQLSEQLPIEHRKKILKKKKKKKKKRKLNDERKLATVARI